MRVLILITAIILTLQVKANINHIDFSKISSDKNLKESFDNVKMNQQYFNHWSPEWNYEKSKEELVNLLEKTYNDFSKVKSQETENNLLLGTISHYLYNLNKTEYYEKAVENFSKVIYTNPNDYRAFWFLGFHYSLSTNTNEAITNLMTAKKLLPKDEPIDFWENYAFTTASANMPSHSIFAMDRIRELSGSKGYIEEQIGDNIRNRIKKVNKTENYKKKDIWSAIEGDMMTFLCRPLGIKILMDSSWVVSIYDFSNGKSACIINPTPLFNDKGRKIEYTIVILMNTVNSTDKLDDYINKYNSKYTDIMKINLNDKYENMVSYEIKDKTMYQEVGGGHLYMIGVERTAPKYPGLLLETPISIPQGNTEKLTFYRASDSKDRFEGKIFYAIMLDTCEDIHDKSFAIFKEFFDKYLIIE